MKCWELPERSLACQELMWVGWYNLNATQASGELAGRWGVELSQNSPPTYLTLMLECFDREMEIFLMVKSHNACG